MIRLLQKILVLLTVLAVIAACSSKSKQPYHAPETRYDSNARPVMGDVSQTSGMNQPREAPRYPWEAWPFGADLNGVLLTNVGILHGDELVRYGDRKKALVEYQLLMKPATYKLLTSAEQDAVVLRIASTQLALKQPEAALVTLSRYCTSRGIGVDQVDPRFALQFAYAYARQGNVSQSLAWFSRLNGLAADRGIPGFSSVPGSAARGIRLVLRSLDDAKLEAMNVEWANDVFVRVLIGEENRRRAGTPGYQPSSDELDKLLEPQIGGAFDPGMSPGSDPDAPPTIIALLPLSGRFASLGNSLKAGMELAVDAVNGASVPLSTDLSVTTPGDPAGVGAAPQPPRQVAKLIVADASEDGLQAVAQARELLAAGNIAAILGPLLAEQVNGVVQVANSAQVPMITFSKGAFLAPNGNTWRLSPTVDSQISSLLHTAIDQLNLTRIALIYPQDSAGEEYAQAFRAGLQDRNLTLALDTSFSSSDPNSLLAIAQQIETSDIEGVFFADGVVSASRFLSNFNSTTRRRIKFFGPLAWDDEAQLSHSRAVMEGVIFVTSFYRASMRPEIVRFNEVYFARYGKRPDFLAAQGFDAATLILAALENGSVPTVADGIKSIGTYEGLTGIIRVGPSIEIERDFVVVQYSSGRPVDVRLQLSEGMLQPTEITTSEAQNLEPQAPQNFVFHGNERIPSAATGAALASQ